MSERCCRCMRPIRRDVWLGWRPVQRDTGVNCPVAFPAPCSPRRIEDEVIQL